MIAGYGRKHERGFAARRPVPKRRRWFRYYRDLPGVASKPSGNVVIIPIPTSHGLASVPIDEEKRRREQQFSPTGEKGNFARSHPLRLSHLSTTRIRSDISRISKIVYNWLARWNRLDLIPEVIGSWRFLLRYFGDRSIQGKLL